MANLTTRIARGAVTRRQREALTELYDMADGTLRRVRGDYMEGATRRALSSLIPWGYVEGRQVRSARRTDYSFTPAGLAVAQRFPIIARRLAASDGSAT